MAAIEIETERLSLRPLSPEDADSLFLLWQEPEMRRYLFAGEQLPRPAVDIEIHESQQLFERLGYGLWGVRRKGAVGLDGFGGFRFFHDPPELQLLCAVTSVRWGQGLGTEACQALMRYGFEELGFAMVLACAGAGNTAAMRLMEKVGMSFDRRAFINGQDSVYYVADRKSFRPATAGYELRPA